MLNHMEGNLNEFFCQQRKQNSVEGFVNSLLIIMDLHCGICFPTVKNTIWRTGKITVMETVSITAVTVAWREIPEKDTLIICGKTG